MKHFKFKKGILACLLSLALAFSCFSTVGIKAEEPAATATAPTAVSATFKWSTNSVEADSAAVVYVLKAQTGNTIKKGAKSVTLAKASQTATKFSATMTELGIKKAKSDVYLYVCDKEFEEDGTSISANLVIKAPAAKKVVGKIDYTKADGEAFNVISATATDNNKAVIKDPEIWWSTEADGTYFQVNNSDESETRTFNDTAKTKAPNGFDGRTLREMLEADGGVIYIKMAGKDGATGDAQFGSQAVKVKIAKPANAPKIKVDAKKDTISVKNGFDFGLAEKDEEGNYVVEHWFTVLPQLKNAEVKTSAASIVPTTEYTPLAKKDTNAGKEVTLENGDKTYSYTAYKLKALSIDTMVQKLGIDNSDDVVIAVRKSATEKKPSSKASYLELSGQSDKPLVYTQENVKGEYLVATSADFDKKGIVAGTVVNYPGSVSGEPTHIATEGYNDTFKVGSVSGQDIVNADTNGAKYEFAILAQKDLVATGESAIDLSTIAWKKFDPAKTKITSKLKTKYSLINGTKTEAKLDTVSAKVEAGSGETTAAQYSGVKNFIVIRRVGDSKSSLRASNWIYLYVVKNGKTYELYSTVDNGEEAFKYTIKFVKYQKVGNNYTWDLASDVEDISVWAATGDKKYVALPESTTAKLFKASAASGDVLTSNAVESVSGGTNKDKYEVTGVADGATEYIAIREYANVKIVAAISGESTTETLVTITNGKSSISGDDTVYYVGDAIEIPSASGAPTAVTGYDINIVNVASPADGFAKVEDGTIKTKAYTAEETTVKVTYLKTPKTFTYDDSAVSGTECTLEKVSGLHATGLNMCTYGTDIKVKITAKTGYEITSVQYRLSSDTNAEWVTITGVEDVYTVPGNVILNSVWLKANTKTVSTDG